MAILAKSIVFLIGLSTLVTNTLAIGVMYQVNYYPSKSQVQTVDSPNANGQQLVDNLETVSNGQYRATMVDTAEGQAVQVLSVQTYLDQAGANTAFQEMQTYVKAQIEAQSGSSGNAIAGSGDGKGNDGKGDGSGGDESGESGKGVEGV
jgi:hypothetical protein